MINKQLELTKKQLELRKELLKNSFVCYNWGAYDIRTTQYFIEISPVYAKVTLHGRHINTWGPISWQNHLTNLPQSIQDILLRYIDILNEP